MPISPAGSRVGKNKTAYPASSLRKITDFPAQIRALRQHDAAQAKAPLPMPTLVKTDLQGPQIGNDGAAPFKGDHHVHWALSNQISSLDFFRYLQENANQATKQL